MTKAELRDVVEAINEKGEQRSRFERLSGDILRHWMANREDDQAHKLLGACSTITESLWAIETTICRIHWQTRLQTKGAIPNHLFFSFTRADYRLYHVEARSLMDHIGVIIRLLPSSKGSPPESFSSLRKKRDILLENKQISEEVYELIDSCEWYEPLTEVRDRIVHKGAKVFPNIPNDKSQYQFAITERSGRAYAISSGPFASRNDGLHEGNLYLAYYMAEVYLVLDCLAGIIYEETGASEESKDGGCRTSGGLEVVRQWMKELYDADLV